MPMNMYSLWPQPPAAALAAEQKLAQARAAQDPTAIVAALLALGEIALTAGAFDQALAHFDEALALAQQHKLKQAAVQSLGAKGVALYHKGDYPAAHTVLSQGLKQALQAGDGPRGLDALVHLGLTEAEMGNTPQAAATLAQGVRQAGAYKDLARQATAANRLGQLLLAVNQPVNAAGYFELAAHNAVQLNKPQTELHARLGLGRAAALQGKQEQALRELTQALALAEAFGEPAINANALGQLVRARLALGETDAAVTDGDEAVARAGLSTPQVQGALLIELGNVWVEQGDFGRALDYLQRALPLVQSYDPGAALVNLHSALGTAHFQLGNYAAADADYRKALALAERLGIVEARAVLHGRLSSILTERQDLAGALAQAEQGVALADELQQPALQGELYMVLAFALYDRGRTEDAAARAHQAHAVFVAQQNTTLARQVETILAEWGATTAG